VCTEDIVQCSVCEQQFYACEAATLSTLGKPHTLNPDSHGLNPKTSPLDTKPKTLNPNPEL